MKLLWLDLETTGLNPQEHRILEVAASLADFEDPFDAREVYHGVLYLPPETRLDPFIEEMHTRNGLLQECLASRLSLWTVQQDLLALIPKVEDKDQRTILAGSTVSFDHAFLREHLAPLDWHLSHRHYDVSALKLFCQSMGMPRLPKGEAHRAKADVAESIAHGRICAAWLRSWRRD